MNCAEALKHPKPIAPSIPIVHVVAAALIDGEGRILLAQRPQGKSFAGQWEFPGGKLEKNELPEYALMRELEEELGIQTRPCCFFPIGFASHSYEDFHLMMPLYTCRIWQGEIDAKEHQKLAWVRPQDLHDYPLLEADIPLVASLRACL